jgi:GNAT superfamily N-acetyltransferase
VLVAEAWVEELLADEEFFVGGWGREGDGGLVAEQDGEPRAAAWFRTFEDARPELRFIDAATPVLVDAWVARDLRGRGHGTAMLEQHLLAPCEQWLRRPRPQVIKVVPRTCDSVASAGQVPFVPSSSSRVASA